MIGLIDQPEPLNGGQIEATADGYRHLLLVVRPMGRHARDVNAKSRPEIVMRSLILPIGLEARGALIPIEVSLPLLVSDKRAVGLVENSKGLIAGDLQ